MRMNTFRKLEQLIEQVNNAEQIVDKTNENQVKQILRQKVLLAEIEEYVWSMKWLKSKELKEKIRFYLLNKCSLNMLENKYNLSETASRKCISRVNQILTDKIGKHTLKYIKDGRVAEAKALFESQSGKLKPSDLLIEQAYKLLPEAEPMAVTLKDCKDELNFIFHNSVALLLKRFETLDNNRLAHIRFILETDHPLYTEERLILLKLILAKIDVDTCIEKLEKVKTFKINKE